ncbi:MAG: hypothetical protein AAF412_03265, partial [Pseudomonadota bacterium]
KLMPKGFPITHFDMHDAEAIGFHKFDVLSQRGLGHIKDAVALVKQNQGKAVDIHEVEKIMKDEQVKAQLRQAKCMGCFYIESPAMRGLLSKLQCDTYKQLVGQTIHDDPDEPADREIIIKTYDAVFHQGSPRYDHVYSKYEREQQGEAYQVAFQRLLLPLRLPNDDPVLGVLVFRTNQIEIDLPLDLQMPIMTKNELMD